MIYCHHLYSDRLPKYPYCAVSVSSFTETLLNRMLNYSTYKPNQLNLQKLSHSYYSRESTELKSNKSPFIYLYLTDL